MFNKILSLMLVVFCIGAFSPDTNAQTSEDPTWMTVYLGHQEYDGDYGNEMMQFNLPKDMGGGVGIQQYLNPSFDLDFSLYMGRLDFEYQGPFSKYMVNSNLLVHYKLSNGYIFKEYSTVRPFISAGVGYSTFVRGDDNRVEDSNGFEIPFGVGFNVPLSDNVHFNYKSTYNRTFNDEIDGNTSLDSRDHDDFMVHTIGLKFKLGASKDTDGDGIADKNDKCINTIGEEATNGCPDRDGDLIIDSEDRCPNQAGVAEFSGCPDTDADGIADYEDACPEIAGTAEFNGCRDTDNDGVANNEDACPTVAGSEATNGCPDNDNDGIANKADRCPDVAGPAATNGCPDADMDGVLNANDACPNRAGLESNNGCPEVSQEVVDTINLIFNNLIFATDKAVIHESSHDEMNELANLMRDDEGLLLRVEGHTDSRGSDEYNQKLSEDRANAVKEYLVEKGIDASRITTVGYGESQPIASNDTQTGLDRNRRVELIVSYQ